MIAEQNIDAMDPAQLRELTARLLAEVKHKDALIEKLTHENAVLKRLKFAARSERFNAEQRSLLEETLDADLQAVSEEIDRLAPASTQRWRTRTTQAPAAAGQPAAARSAPRARGHDLQLRLPDEANW